MDWILLGDNSGNKRDSSRGWSQEGLDTKQETYTSHKAEREAKTF